MIFNLSERVMQRAAVLKSFDLSSAFRSIKKNDITGKQDKKKVLARVPAHEGIEKPPLFSSQTLLCVCFGVWDIGKNGGEK